MAYKTWAVGDVLTAADMNAMVRDQTYTICTSNTRPTGSINGHFIYETDTGRVYVSNGTGGFNLLTMRNPPQWEMSGSSGQNIPPAPGSTAPVGSIVENVAMGAMSANPMSATIAIPGKYICSWGFRMDFSSNMTGHNRSAFWNVTRGGNLYRQYVHDITWSGTYSGNFYDEGSVLRVTSPVRLNAGDIVKPFMRHNYTGVTFHTDNQFAECTFSGIWVSP